MPDFPAMHQYSALTSALSPASFLKTRPCRSLNLLTQPLDALKLSMFSWVAIIFTFSLSVVPAIGILDALPADTRWRAQFPILQMSTPYQFFSSCARYHISLFVGRSRPSWRIEFNVLAANPSCFAMYTRFSPGFFSTSSIIFNRLCKNWIKTEN
jgi:hypothetical protein